MQTKFNPKWLAFLSERGLTTAQADAMERSERISLNADFMCWNMRNLSPERKSRFFSA